MLSAEGRLADPLSGWCKSETARPQLGGNRVWAGSYSNYSNYARP